MEETYLNFSKLIRVTAWILTFIRNLRHKTKQTGSLTALQLKTAKKHWELHTQQKNFSDVYQALKTNEKNSLKEQLGLKLDEDGHEDVMAIL